MIVSSMKCISSSPRLVSSSRLDVDGADRAAVLRQRLGGGAALRGDEVAHGLAGEIRLARELGEVGFDARAAAGGAGR